VDVCMLILSHGLFHLPSPRRAPGLFGPASFARALFTNGVVRGVLRGSLPLGHAQHIEGYTLWIGKLAAHNVFGAQERWVGCSSNYTWRPPRRLANLPLGTPLQRTSRRVVHVGPGRSHRPFFLPLFTNVVEVITTRRDPAPPRAVVRKPSRPVEVGVRQELV
jgi:hypothetical protein